MTSRNHDARGKRIQTSFLSTYLCGIAYPLAAYCRRWTVADKVAIAKSGRDNVRAEKIVEQLRASLGLALFYGCSGEWVEMP